MTQTHLKQIAVIGAVSTANPSSLHPSNLIFLDRSQFEETFLQRQVGKFVLIPHNTQRLVSLFNRRRVFGAVSLARRKITSNFAPKLLNTEEYRMQLWFTYNPHLQMKIVTCAHN